MGQPVEGQTSHEAFATYVLPEVEVLLRVARTLARHGPDAEDLVQDTLLGAYRSIDRFDGRHPRAWLFTILRNTHHNRGRRRRPDVAPEGEAERMAAPATDEPETVILASCLDAAVERAFLALPDRFRRVVELVDLDGLSYQEAAVTLGVPAGTRPEPAAPRPQPDQGLARGGRGRATAGGRPMRWPRRREDDLRCKEVGRSCSATSTASSTASEPAR